MPQPRVRTGLDVLCAEGFRRLAGRRVGLVCHPASVAGDLVHAVELFRAALGSGLVRLFGPQHGILGQTQDNMVEWRSFRDPETGIECVSLYGEHRRPTPEMLGGLDVLVVDLQDVGARYYTFNWTTLLCMRSAAEAGVEVMVLDRPNPISGELREGPVLDMRFESFVGLAEVPARHGLTAGEMARFCSGLPIDPREFPGGGGQLGEEARERFFPELSSSPAVGAGVPGCAGRGRDTTPPASGRRVRSVPPPPGNSRSRSPCRLEVVAMEGYRRAMDFAATGLPWVMPSPNMPTPETALVYPGMCLLEGTMLSEGRGTARPFEIFGAPFVDARRLVRRLEALRLPGVVFRPMGFEPTFQKHAGKLCGGAQLHVTDRAAFRPVLTAVAALAAVRELWPREFAWKSPPYEYETGKLPFDILAGSDRLRLDLEAGRDAREIAAGWQAEVEAFSRRAAPVLLYD